MAWNRSTVKVEDEKKSAKKYHAWHGLAAGLIVVAAAGAAVLGVSSKGSAVDEEVAAAEEKEELAKPKQSTAIREVKPAAAPVYNVVAEKLQGQVPGESGVQEKGQGVSLSVFGVVVSAMPCGNAADRQDLCGNAEGRFGHRTHSLFVRPR